jgi:selenocysteine-specific elongation factor
MASDTPQHLPADEGFRLAVDRCFTLGGIGTVVTGAVHRGRVRVGDALRVVPGELTARVRSIHTNDRASDEAQAGQRCALALAGVSKDDVPRGSWVVEPSIALATQRVDVRLRLWRGEVQPLKSGAQVHVHAGTAAATGTVALLDMPALAPGEACLAQLVLHRPLALWRGDRIVLRDASASRTLAGAEVLDPFAPTRYRQTPQRLRELAALEQGAAAALLAASAHGVDWQRLRIAWGLPAAPPVPAEALEAGDWVLAPTQAGAASALALQALTGFHAAHPDEPGPDAKRLRRLTVPRLPEPLWQALLQRLIASGRVAQRGACLHLPAHEARLNATELRIGQKAMPQLQRAGFEGAWVRDLGAAIGEPEPLVRAALAALARRGELHQVVRDLYYTPEALAAMAQIARGLAAADAHQGLSAAQFRDATGLGRKRAIQVLEYFDRVGLLRRAGEQHRLRVDCELFRDAR